MASTTSSPADDSRLTDSRLTGSTLPGRFPIAIITQFNTPSHTTYTPSNFRLSCASNPPIEIILLHHHIALQSLYIELLSAIQDTLQGDISRNEQSLTFKDVTVRDRGFKGVNLYVHWQPREVGWGMYTAVHEGNCGAVMRRLCERVGCGDLVVCVLRFEDARRA